PVVTISRATFQSNESDYAGGAIEVDGGNVTVNESTFYDNRTHFGGAIDIWTGELTVSRSTFRANVAGSDGGAIENYASLTVSNSTFVNNRAGGTGSAIDHWRGTATLNHVTVVGNTSGGGGAVAFDSEAEQLEITNSIIAMNSPANCGGVEPAGSNNLSDDDSCGDAFDEVDLAELDLQPIGDNGGLTETIALGPDSVAID